MRSLDSLCSLEMTREMGMIGMAREVRMIGATREMGSVEMTREMGMAGIDIGSLLLLWLRCDA
ncbi:MAG: hypothetical protein ABF408_08995 [Bifidobacterium aquikefiri]